MVDDSDNFTVCSVGCFVLKYASDALKNNVDFLCAVTDEFTINGDSVSLDINFDDQKLYGALMSRPDPCESCFSEYNCPSACEVVGEHPRFCCDPYCENYVKHADCENFDADGEYCGP